MGIVRGVIGLIGWGVAALIVVIGILTGGLAFGVIVGLGVCGKLIWMLIKKGE